MKQLRIILILVSFWITYSASAQLTGDCVFLQGKYVELGIAPNGGYGGTLPAPSGYHPNMSSLSLWDPALAAFTSSTNFLGFVADYGRDGWSVGTPPFFGDFYLPGSPQEGWAIQVNGALSTAYIPSFQTSGATGYTGTLTGGNVSYSSTSGISRGVWMGNQGALSIKQTTVLDTNKLYFTINVVLKNTGATTLTNIYYVRTVDPDNVEILTGAGNFYTLNTINYQLPNVGNKVLVSAIDTVSSYATHSFLGLGTKDCRAKCMYFDAGLAPGYGLDAMWAGTTPYTYTLGTSAINDVGIALDYNIGSISPGDSTSLTYAYILNAAYIDSALNATQPAFLINTFSFNSGDSINLCTYNFDTVLIQLGSGGFYHWHWSPDSLITDTAAVSNVIDVSGISTPLTYTITGVNVSGACDTVAYYLTLSHDTFTINLTNRDTSICYGNSVQTNIIGSPFLRYVWTPAAGVSNPNIQNPIITPSITATYTVTAYSDTNCRPVAKHFIINVFDPHIDSITFNNPSVCGYHDGSFTLYGLQTGLFDTLHYTFNSIPQAPLPVGVSSTGNILITGLGAGVYSNIYVKAGLCNTNVVGPITLVNPPPPIVTVDSPYVKTCVGVPVQLHSYVSSTGIPINYIWSPAIYLSSSTISSPIVTPAMAGDITYTITVNPGTSAACATFDTVHVHTLAPFVLINNDTPICLGHYVQAFVNGSTEYNCVWTPSAGVSNTTIINPTFSPVTTTEYVITANYAHCPAQVDSFNIEVDTTAIPVNITDTICLGMTDSFNVAVPGPGTGSNYYHYRWIPAADISNDTLPNPIITPIVTGTHTYSVMVNPHALNCQVIDIINIFVLPNRISVTPHDTAICLGKVVQVVGAGDPLFHYQWIPTAGISVSNALSTLITPDTSATYIVTASFGRCPDMIDSLHLWVEPNPSVYIGGNRLMCEFDTLHINSFVNPAWYDSFTYAWTPATGLDFTTTATVVYTAGATTDIYLTVSTPAGCKSDDSAHITVFGGNFLSITPDHAEFCPHDTVAVPTTNTSSTTLSYHWYPSRYLSDSTSGSPLISPVSNQVYTIVGSTPNGCKDTAYFKATVYPAALISIPDSVTLYPGESYQIEPLTNCTSFSWFPPVGLSASRVSNPDASPAISTRYTVNGVTVDGCKAVDSIDVFVNPESLLAVPNAFMPGTGVNNEYKIIKKGIATLNYFRIFNRWGNLVFETTNINQGWDGTYNGKPQPFGVYVYDVQAVTSAGTVFNKKGNVTLIR